MIAYLKGNVTRVLPTTSEIILSTNGIGYKVGTSNDLSLQLKTGDEIALFTHLVVRENSLSLYGFRGYDELKMFESLIEISGIGPKMAMGILSTATVPEIKQAIENGNVELFTSVSGIGKKNARRIIIELQTKLEGLEARDIMTATDTDEVAGALQNLGYSRSEIKTVLRMIDRTKSTKDQIKDALTRLGT